MRHVTIVPTQVTIDMVKAEIESLFKVQALTLLSFAYVIQKPASARTSSVTLTRPERDIHAADP